MPIDCAFYGCSSLTSITIPDSVTRIGSGAFSDCDNLSRIYITDIAAWCNIEFDYHGNPLSDAHNLYLNNVLVTELYVPSNVTSIGDYAFEGCSITSVTIGNSVISIGYSAFYNCGSLTSVTIPDSVTSIGKCAFSDCSSLTSVTIPDSVTSIGDSAFSGCSSLTSVTIPNSVTSIGVSAFNRCYSLTSIEIPDSVRSIDRYAFSCCYSLTSITIGNSVIYIASDAFSDCYHLVEIYNLSSLKITKGAYGYDVYTDKNTPSKLSKESDFVIHTDGNVKTVVNYFGDKSEITIPSGVTNIKKYAFYGCSSLTSITIPNSVTSIGEYAFLNCESLTNITVDENNKNYKSIDGNLYTKDGTILIQYAVGKTDISFKIPNNVTSIGDYAFYGCYSLTSITIPDSVTSIGDRVFSDCSSLTSITIGNSVTSIGWSAFYNCSSLTSIMIPNSVTSIEYGAFCDCSSLKTIYCEAESEPSGWSYNWKSNCSANVIWGYNGN